jgi:hypothetical protein
MRKDEIRSTVRNTLPKYDKSGRYGDRYIDACVEKALASLYHDVFLTNPLSLPNYAKGYGYATPIAIQTENSTGIKYCTLPESIIPLEQQGSGVLRVATPTQGQVMFYPTYVREVELFANGSFVNTVNTKVGYVVNQTRVEFYGLPASITGVKMDLLIPFSKYAEDDEVKIPELTEVTGTNYRQVAQTFMDRVMSILQVVQPVDLRDDNAGGAIQKDN